MDTYRMAVILRITKKIVDGPRSIARGRRFNISYSDCQRSLYDTVEKNIRYP